MTAQITGPGGAHFERADHPGADTAAPEPDQIEQNRQAATLYQRGFEAGYRHQKRDGTSAAVLQQYIDDTLRPEYERTKRLLDINRAALLLSKSRADVLERQVRELEALIDQLGEDPNPDSEEPADVVKRHHAKAWDWCRIANDACAEARALREDLADERAKRLGEQEIIKALTGADSVTTTLKPKRRSAMMAQVLEQEVQPDSVPPEPPEPETAEDLAKQLDTALSIAAHFQEKSDGLAATVAKHQRKQAIQISVRFDEREYPPAILLKLFTLRQEINNLNRAQRSANQTIARLRHEVRLRDRVMKLKSESADLALASYHSGLQAVGSFMKEASTPVDEAIADLEVRAERKAALGAKG